jgi:hypothetical protein
MTSEHQDVLLAIFHLFAGLQADFDPEKNQVDRYFINVQFTAKAVLDLLGKSYDKTGRQWLRDRLDELTRVHMTMLDAGAADDAWPLFSGFILGFRSIVKKGVSLSVSIPVEFARVFAHQGYGQVDLVQRKALGSSQLAKLLQVEIETLKDRRNGVLYPLSLEKWHTLTGSKATLKSFTYDLRGALTRLQTVGVISSFTVVKGKVHIVLPNATAKAPTGAPGCLTTKTADGETFRLGEEVPAIDELLNADGTPDDVLADLWTETQLLGMLKLYPKAYGGRKGLPALLKWIQARLLAIKPAAPELFDYGEDAAGTFENEAGGGHDAFPPMDDLLNDAGKVDQFYLELFGNSQLRAMHAAYPQANAGRWELPDVLRSLEIQLDTRQYQFTG